MTPELQMKIATEFSFNQLLSTCIIQEILFHNRFFNWKGYSDEQFNKKHNLHSQLIKTAAAGKT